MTQYPLMETALRYVLLDKHIHSNVTEHWKQEHTPAFNDGLHTCCALVANVTS